MSVTVPADGAVVTNAFLTAVSEQIVWTCTSSTRPTGVEGRTINETDTDRRYVYDGSAWVLNGWNTAAARPWVSLSDSAQSITTASATDITWGTEVADPDGWTSGGSATLTVPTGFDGLYIVTGTAAWASGTLGTTPGAFILHNGTNIAGANGPTFGQTHTVTTVLALAATDTLKMQVYQNSGGSVNVSSTFRVVRLGR
jgi:hypothetical protein